MCSENEQEKICSPSWKIMYEWKMSDKTKALKKSKIEKWWKKETKKNLTTWVKFADFLTWKRNFYYSNFFLLKAPDWDCIFNFELISI